MSRTLTSRDRTKKAVEVVGGEEDTPYPMAPKVSAIKMTFSPRMFGTLRLIPNFVGALTPGASTPARGCHIRGPKLGGVSPKETAGLGRGRELRLAPSSLRLPPDWLPLLPVLPPCTCWASCLWRVPCSPLH